MDDLIKIVLGLGGALILLVLGAKSIENLSRDNRKADDLFRDEKKSEPFLWIMVGVMYASVLAAFIFKNLIFVWVIGGFIALAYLFKPVVILMHLLGLAPIKDMESINSTRKLNRLQNDLRTIEIYQSI